MGKPLRMSKPNQFLKQVSSEGRGEPGALMICLELPDSQRKNCQLEKKNDIVLSSRDEKETMSLGSWKSFQTMNFENSLEFLAGRNVSVPFK